MKEKWLCGIIKIKGKISAIRKEIETPLFMLILFCLIFVLFYLFLNQTRGLFRSDLTAHIGTALRGRGYSLNNVFLALSHRIAGDYGCAAYLTLIVLLTMLISGFFLKIYIQRDLKMPFQLSSAFLIAISLFFLGGIYIPKVYPVFYLASNYSGPGSPCSLITQPWHNSTYLLMRFFGIITVMLFSKIYKTYLQKGLSIREWLLFTISLTLTNAAKPNFFIAFAPAMLLFLIRDFVRQKGKGISRMFQFGTCVLFSMPILLFQEGRLFSNNTNSVEEVVHGVAFTVKVIRRLWMEGTLLPCLVTGLFFFIIITILCARNNLLDSELYFGWTMMIISIIEGWFIVETGPRAADGNFGWGIYFCSFYLAFICVERLFALKERIQRSTYCLILLPYVFMLITGITYFIHLLRGGDYIV